MPDQRAAAPWAQHNYWGQFDSVAQFPNVAGSSHQSNDPQAGDTAWLDAGPNSNMYVCTDPTRGAAVWVLLGGGGGGGGFPNFQVKLVANMPYTLQASDDNCWLVFPNTGDVIVPSSLTPAPGSQSYLFYVQSVAGGGISIIGDGGAVTFVTEQPPVALGEGEVAAVALGYIAAPLNAPAAFVQSLSGQGSGSLQDAYDVGAQIDASNGPVTIEATVGVNSVPLTVRNTVPLGRMMQVEGTAGSEVFITELPGGNSRDLALRFDTDVGHSVTLNGRGPATQGTLIRIVSNNADSGPSGGIELVPGVGLGDHGSVAVRSQLASPGFQMAVRGGTPVNEETPLMLLWVDDQGVEHYTPVGIGVTDSGGNGYRVLRVPNDV